MTKMVKNPKNYTENFDCRLLTVNFRQAVKNVSTGFEVSKLVTLPKQGCVATRAMCSGNSSSFFGKMYRESQ